MRMINRPANICQRHADATSSFETGMRSSRNSIHLTIQLAQALDDTLDHPIGRRRARADADLAHAAQIRRVDLVGRFDERSARTLLARSLDQLITVGAVASADYIEQINFSRQLANRALILGCRVADRFADLYLFG